jgi:hypothetical protein
MQNSYQQTYVVQKLGTSNRGSLSTNQIAVPGVVPAKKHRHDDLGREFGK